MKRSQKVIAVTLLAAALCADRAVAAAPAMRMVGASVAGRLVARLSVRFQRAVPTQRLYQNRSESDRATSFIPCADDRIGHALSLSPTQFRLPPPAL